MIFLSDYRLDCENCASVKLQVLQILAKDSNGPFVVNAYRCPRCEWFFPVSADDEPNFDRFMQADGDQI